MLSIQAIGILVTVGLFVISLVMTWVVFLLKRFIGKQDTLQEAMFYPTGPVSQIRADISGINLQLPTFVKSDKLELTERRLQESIETLRKEGNTREVRILEAVSDANESNKKDNEDVRKQITGVHVRIDNMYERRQERSA